MYSGQQILQVRKELERLTGINIQRSEHVGDFQFVFVCRRLQIEIRFRLNISTQRYEVTIPSIIQLEDSTTSNLAQYDRSLNALMATSKIDRPPESMASHLYRNLLMNGDLFQRWESARTAAAKAHQVRQNILLETKNLAELVDGRLMEGIKLDAFSKAAFKGKVGSIQIQGQILQEGCVDLVLSGLTREDAISLIASVKQRHLAYKNTRESSSNEGSGGII